MIYTSNFTKFGDTLHIPSGHLEQLIEQGLEGLPEVIRVMVNEAMHIERENYLRTRPCERIENRMGHYSEPSQKSG